MNGYDATTPHTEWPGHIGGPTYWTWSGMSPKGMEHQPDWDAIQRGMKALEPPKQCVACGLISMKITTGLCSTCYERSRSREWQRARRRRR